MEVSLREGRPGVGITNPPPHRLILLTDYVILRSHSYKLSFAEQKERLLNCGKKSEDSLCCCLAFSLVKKEGSSRINNVNFDLNNPKKILNLFASTNPKEQKEQEI